MSALVTGQGAVFVNETSNLSAAISGSFLYQTAGGPGDLTGTLGPAITLAGALDSFNQKLTLTYSPNTARSNLTAIVGVKFIANVDIIFNWIGMRNGGGVTFGGDHSVGIYDWNDNWSQIPIRQATINLDAFTSAIQYVYAQIPQITLKAGREYFVGVPVVAGDGTVWADQKATTLRPEVSSIQSAYITPDGTVTFSTTNFQYFGVDLNYVYRGLTQDDQGLVANARSGPGWVMSALTENNPGSQPGTAYSVTIPRPTWAGDTIMGFVVFDTTTLVSVTDDKGNTYPIIESGQDDYPDYVRVFSGVSVVGGARTFTANFSAGPITYPQMGVDVYYAVTGLDVHASHWNPAATSGVTDEVVTPSITPTVPNTIIWALALNPEALSLGNTTAAGTGWTQRIQTFDTYIGYAPATEDQPRPNAAAISATFTPPAENNAGWWTAIAALKLDTGGPPVTVTGALAITQADQGLVGKGDVPGVLALNILQDSQTLTGACSVAQVAFGALNLVQDDQALNGAGELSTIATLTITQDPHALVGNARAAISGGLNVTQGAHTLIAQAKSAIFGTLNVTQASHALNGLAGLTAKATLVLAQDPQSLLAAASTVVRGTLNATQQAQTLQGNCVVFFGATLSLNLTQAPQTINALGTSPWTAALNLTQAPQVLTGKGDTPVISALNLTQASQSLTAKAGPVVRGALVQAQDDQTILASGALKLTGTLSVTQVAQTLIGAGNVPSANAIGTLRLTQDDQTLVGAASLGGVVGSVIVTQAPQTLVGSGEPVVRGALNQTQAPHGFAGLANGAANGSLVKTQTDHSLQAAGSVPYVGKLNLTQAPNILVGKATAEIRATLLLTQGDQTLTGKAGPLAAGRLIALQDDHVLTGNLDAAGGARLNLVQDSQILVGAIQGSNPAALVLTQDPQTLVGFGAGEASMTLRVTQANQTISARASTFIEAKLVAYQSNQTLIAHDQPGTAIQAQARVMVQA